MGEIIDFDSIWLVVHLASGGMRMTGSCAPESIRFFVHFHDLYMYAVLFMPSAQCNISLHTFCGQPTHFFVTFWRKAPDLYKPTPVLLQFHSTTPNLHQIHEKLLYRQEIQLCGQKNCPTGKKNRINKKKVALTVVVAVAVVVESIVFIASHCHDFWPPPRGGVPPSQRHPTLYTWWFRSEFRCVASSNYQISMHYIVFLSPYRCWFLIKKCQKIGNLALFSSRSTRTAYRHRTKRLWPN